MTLYSGLITNGRHLLQDSDANAYRWTDAELLTYAVEATTEFFRYTKSMRNSASATITSASNGIVTFAAAATGAGLAATDVYMLHKAYWNGEVIGPTTISQLESSDDGWGIDWESESGDPSRYTQETTGLTGMRLVPKPDQDGTLKIWYYQIPSTAYTTASTVAIPAAFENVIVYYMLYRAFGREVDSPGGSNYLGYAKFYKQEYDRLLAEAAHLIASGINADMIFRIPHQNF